MPANDLPALLRQFENMMRAVAANPQIEESDLRRVLRFISKMVQVVNQAFSNVYPVLNEVRYLRTEQLNGPKQQELLQELERLVSRQYYREMEMICGQLEALEKQYGEMIAPIIQSLGADVTEEFGEVFSLLEHHEGEILNLINDVTWKVIGKLHVATDAATLREAQLAATKSAAEIKASIQELQLISNKILGLSGKEGFLELTRTDRMQLQEEIRYHFNYTDNRISTGNVSGQQVAIGQDIDQEIRTETHQGMDAREVHQLIDELIAELRREGLPGTVEDKVINKLEVSKEELEEAEPDKEYIRKNLEKATDTMQKAGKLIDQGSSIGLKLIKIGKWVGAALAFL